MLASSGEITEPCPVPVSLTVTTPSSRTPALSHFWIRRMMRRSAIRCSTKRISHSWLTESKEGPDVRIENPVHLLAGDPDHQRIREPSAHGLVPWGIMLAAPGSKPIREPEEFFLVDRVQRCGGRPLDNFVLQRGHRREPSAHGLVPWGT